MATAVEVKLNATRILKMPAGLAIDAAGDLRCARE